MGSQQSAGLTPDGKFLITRGTKINLWEMPEVMWNKEDLPQDAGAIENRLAMQPGTTIQLAPSLLGSFSEVLQIEKSSDSAQLGFWMWNSPKQKQKIVILDTKTWQTHTIPNNPTRTKQPLGAFFFLPGGNSIGISIGEEIWILDKAQWKKDWVERSRIKGISKVVGLVTGQPGVAGISRTRVLGGTRLLGQDTSSGEIKVWDLVQPDALPTPIKYDPDYVTLGFELTGKYCSYRVANGSAISHDGKLIALPGKDGLVYLMDTSTGKGVAKLEMFEDQDEKNKNHRFETLKLGFAPHKDRLIAIMKTDYDFEKAPVRVCLWNTKTMKFVSTLAVQSGQESLSDEAFGFTSDGTVAFVTWTRNTGGDLQLFDTESGKAILKRPLRGLDRADRVGLSSRSQKICVREDDEGFVLYDSKVLKPYGFLRQGGTYNGIWNEPIYVENGMIIIKTPNGIMMYGSWDKFPQGTVPFLDFDD